MGYQALLFCPDEKLSRIVGQVFTELDFTVEHVQEPFGAVKRLMAQRFDAVVVDCENEPNATLLFKSARNSSANQNSLAIAVVEGQSGVAKAYRIGANLVLTKPINVDHAKGTLRVARGLLRKNTDATSTAAHTNVPVAASAPKSTIAQMPSIPVKVAEPTTAPPQQNMLPDLEPALPAMAASKKDEECAVAAVPVDVQPILQVPDQQSTESQVRTAPEQTKSEAVVPSSLSPTVVPIPSHGGAAAAPAPAKETPVEKKPLQTIEFEAAYQKDAGTSTLPTASAQSGPTFSGLEEETSGSRGGKKILVAAAAVLVFAAGGYAGWTKFSNQKTSVPVPAVSRPQPPTPAAPSATTPMSAPATTPATNRVGANSSSGTAQTAPTSVTAPAASANTPVLRIDANTKPEAKNLDVTRIIVKSTPKPSAAGTEELAQLPSPLAVGTSNEAGLSSLAAVSLRSQPSLAKVTISQGVSQGLLIKRVQPRYPQNALAMHLQGAVQLDATIDKEGKIANLKVLKGDAVLARAAVDAVRQWRYKPYYLDGVPVDIETQITVNFKLPN